MKEGVIHFLIHLLCSFYGQCPFLLRITFHAGVLESLTAILTNGAALCDLTMLQQLLWVLTSLADDDAAYKDAMREVGTLTAVARLLNIYLLPDNTGLFRCDGPADAGKHCDCRFGEWCIAGCRCSVHRCGDVSRLLLLPLYLTSVSNFYRLGKHDRTCDAA